MHNGGIIIIQMHAFVHATIFNLDTAAQPGAMVNAPR
jgi:hypothetical protein